MTQMKTKALIFAVFALLMVGAWAQQQEPAIFQILPSLKFFQQTSGGFIAKGGEEPNVAASMNGMFLATVFGQKNSLKPDLLIRFLETTRNSDGGYGNTPGAASALASTKDALYALGYLGANVEKAPVERYIQSLFDKESGLFAATPGGKGAIGSTAQALEALQVLAVLDKEVYTKMFPKINAALTAAKKTEGGVSSFTFADNTVHGANYFGIITGYFTGFEFGALSQWAPYFTRLQTTRGAFSDMKGEPSLEATYYSLQALSYLERAFAKSKSVQVSNIDNKTLLRFILRATPLDLNVIGRLVFVLADTAAFQELFAREVTYESFAGPQVQGKTIIQGTKFRVGFVLQAQYGTQVEGLDVSAALAIPGNSANFKLPYDAEKRNYSSSEIFDTSDRFGAASVNVTINIQLPGDRAVVFTVSDSKVIGYSVTILPTATKKSGDAINQGQVIGVGDEFTLDVQVKGASDAAILSGPFSTVFTVVDSANVKIDEQTIQGKDNKKPFTFKYTVPSVLQYAPGYVLFTVAVVNADGSKSEQSLYYQFAHKLVVADVVLKKSVLQVGESLTVSGTLGALEGGKVTTLSQDERSVVMDVLIGENVFQSVPGKLSGDQYTFTTPVKSTFGSLGDHGLAFRYVPAVGQAVTLEVYSTKTASQIEQLTYTVESKLKIEFGAKLPAADSAIAYGETIAYNFTVQDSLSGRTIWPDFAEYTNVELVLRHPSQSGSFVSAVQKTTVLEREGENEVFFAEWAASPNALAGPASIEVTATLASGPIVIHSHTMLIAGVIEHDAVLQAVSVGDHSHEGVLLAFKLHSKGKQLAGAQLVAHIELETESGVEELYALPVARNDGGLQEDGTIAEPLYSISWSQVEAASQAGKFHIHIVRAVDESHAPQGAQPLFTHSFDYEGPVVSYLPFRTETVVLLVIGALFIVFSYRKGRIELN